MPLTATNKVDKAPLRRAGWSVSDPVFWRATAELSYSPFSDAEAQAYREQFRAHGRADLLPPPS
jgi:fatty-acyl-CoA synthase